MKKFTVGVLDCKVDGGFIENIAKYKEHGYDIITSRDLDKPTKSYDVLAVTWTRLNEKRLRNVNCRAVVVKDNDEPDNVCDPEVLKRLGIPYYLIENWGISTRVAWNLKMMYERRLAGFVHPEGEIANCTITMIANTPSHDAIRDALIEKHHANALGRVYYPMTPKGTDAQTIANCIKQSDVVIVHLGKMDFGKGWLDAYLPYFVEGALFISTTRGPLYSANILNPCVRERRLIAVLDWAWEEEKLLPHPNLHLTRHQSYKSEQAKAELTTVTHTAIQRALGELGT